MTDAGKKIPPKRRVAFVGGGALVIPSYRALLERLGEIYDLTVYAEFHVDATAAHYTIRSVPKGQSRRRLRDRRVMQMILQDHRSRPFDIVHTHSTVPTGVWGIMLSRLLRIPVVVSLDAAEASALPDLGFGDLLTKKSRALNRWVIRRADAVIVLSEFHLRELRENLKIDRPVHVVPRGVDLRAFPYTERPIELPLKILNVAYLHPVKDQETLLRAFAIIRSKADAVLVQVGRDYNNGTIQRMAKEMGLTESVTFEGSIPHSDLPRHYAWADLLLHTSRFESQAIVMNEAMASGVPVCGTHVGLLADLSGRCCLTVPPRDAGVLASTVLRLIENPGEMTRLRRSAHAWSLEHDLDATVREHEKIYEGLIGGR